MFLTRALGIQPLSAWRPEGVTYKNWPIKSFMLFTSECDHKIKKKPPRCHGMIVLCDEILQHESPSKYSLQVSLTTEALVLKVSRIYEFGLRYQLVVSLI